MSLHYLHFRKHPPSPFSQSFVFPTVSTDCDRLFFVVSFHVAFVIPGDTGRPVNARSIFCAFSSLSRNPGKSCDSQSAGAFVLRPWPGKSYCTSCVLTPLFPSNASGHSPRVTRASVPRPLRASTARPPRDRRVGPAGPSPRAHTYASCPPEKRRDASRSQTLRPPEVLSPAVLPPHLEPLSSHPSCRAHEIKRSLRRYDSFRFPLGCSRLLLPLRDLSLCMKPSTPLCDPRHITPSFSTLEPGKQGSSRWTRLPYPFALYAQMYRVGDGA